MPSKKVSLKILADIEGVSEKQMLQTLIQAYVEQNALTRDELTKRGYKAEIL